MIVIPRADNSFFPPRIDHGRARCQGQTKATKAGAGQLFDPLAIRQHGQVIVSVPMVPRAVGTPEKIAPVAFKNPLDFAQMAIDIGRTESSTIDVLITQSN